MGILTIFRGFRRFLEALEGIAFELGALVEVQKDAGTALERIDTLELSRHKFEAECEGKLLQADGKLKAASNAEARERQLKRSYERLVDESDIDGAVPEAAEGSPVLSHDVAASETERMRSLPLVLETNTKAHAVRAKWG